MTFYDEMQGVATELLGEFAQGEVSLKRVTVGPQPNEWTPGEETIETWPLKATVRRVSQKYVDGSLIVATDNQVTFAVPSVAPVLTDKLVIDGVEHAMKDLRPIPGAGTSVAYIAFIAG